MVESFTEFSVQKLVIEIVSSQLNKKKVGLGTKIQGEDKDGNSLSAQGLGRYQLMRKIEEKFNISFGNDLGKILAAMHEVKAIIGLVHSRLARIR